jgi:hypothetical protein
LTDSDINALFMRQDIESIFQQSLISRMVGASGAYFWKQGEIGVYDLHMKP